MSTTNPLVGKILTAVYLADDRKAIRFDVQGEKPIVARTDGDCCSNSWIENVEAPEAIIGSPILQAENLDLSDNDEQDGDYGDRVAHYGFRIVTARGACTLDYRNASNGYYGGDLAWPGDYFYGGVYGQNVSSEKWKPLATAVAK